MIMKFLKLLPRIVVFVRRNFIAEHERKGQKADFRTFFMTGIIVQIQ